MNSIYVGQDWRAKGDAVIDISSANPLQIRFKKPNGDTENRAATLDGTTKAYIDLTPSDTDEAGLWHFQIYAKIGSAEYLGKTYIQTVLNVYA